MRELYPRVIYNSVATVQRIVNVDAARASVRACHSAPANAVSVDKHLLYFQTDALCGMGKRTRYFSTKEPHGRGRPLQPRTADMLHAPVSQRGITAVRLFSVLSRSFT